MNWQIHGRQIPVRTLDTAVIGSGAAGYNAALRLWELGRREIALITEEATAGTSRNTGSDKQTYYKLSLAGAEGDSVAALAADLYAGGGMDGEVAYAQAAGSVRGFMHLCDLGVPFPTNEWGEYAGYKTDHDPRSRATSAGPLTSRYMTEALERAVTAAGIPVWEGLTAVQLILEGDRIGGVLCLDRASLAAPHHGLTAVLARQVILATGGPAGCYGRSVYPESQTGMTGMALEAGATAANLDQWQYGLASLDFRWNLSGTYQQVLPRYISVDRAGVEREFLPDYFPTPAAALDAVFLKGYQWPFDSKKLPGSTLIDLIVHRETVDLGRRVYLDYRTDPRGLEKGFGGLSAECREYLARSGALLPTPIARLQQMNPAAVELYRSHGIDLYTEPLAIGVCAQHHNGGLAVDGHWQTDLSGLYAVGEAAGTFGARRPGGSALNATQVGSLRAAEQIAYSTSPAPVHEETGKEAAAELLRRLDRVTLSPDADPLADRQRDALLMSDRAAHLRDPEKMRDLAADQEEKLRRFWDAPRIREWGELPALLKNRDLLLTRAAVLAAMVTAAEEGSRGAALVLDGTGVSLPRLPYRYAPERPGRERDLLLTRKEGEGFFSRWRAPTPLPTPDNWFERVWADYRRRRGGN